MTKSHPREARKQTNSNRYAPAPPHANEEQQEIREIELLFNRECPEHAVDGVARVWIEIVKHQQVHAEVVDEEARHIDTNGRSGKQQEQEQRDEVRRIEPVNPSFPERAKTNLRLDVSSSGPGPLQVNTEAGDHEEQKDTDVAERARELDKANRVMEEVVWKNVFALLDGVIKNDAQRRSASKRIDATKTIGEMRWGNDHLRISYKST